MPRRYIVPAAALLLVAVSSPFASEASAAKAPRGYKGTVTITHAGSAQSGFFLETDAGGFVYKGRYRVSGRTRHKHPGGLEPRGPWYHLTGSGTNDLALHHQARTTGAFRDEFSHDLEGQGRIVIAGCRPRRDGRCLLARPGRPARALPFELMLARGRAFLELMSLLGPDPPVPGFPVSSRMQLTRTQSCDEGEMQSRVSYQNGVTTWEPVWGTERCQPPPARQEGQADRLSVWPLLLSHPLISAGESVPPLCKPPRGLRSLRSSSVACMRVRRGGRIRGRVTTGTYRWDVACPFVPYGTRPNPDLGGLWEPRFVIACQPLDMASGTIAEELGTRWARKTTVSLDLRPIR
jgi:hypothetical protein